METVGSLVDKISIAKIREYKAQQIGNKELQYKVALQVSDLEGELDSLVEAIAHGKVTKITEDKNKIYFSEPVSINNKQDTIASNITELFTANITLWELEDLRRDKSMEDTARLIAADNVSVYNKIRNQKIDRINELIAIKFANKG
jgi:hypothetical protein